MSALTPTPGGSSVGSVGTHVTRESVPDDWKPMDHDDRVQPLAYRHLYASREKSRDEAMTVGVPRLNPTDYRTPQTPILE